MTEEATPFGGENIPFNELKIPQESKPLPVGPKNKLLVPVLLGIIIVLLLSILFLFISEWQKPRPVVLPSPTSIIVSPSPEATASSLSISERLTGLDNQLEKVDLAQTEITFPYLDFNLDFGKKN